MITRAIVEEIVDGYKYRVRIPIFDRIEQSALSTKFEDLAVATACLPKGIVDDIKVGDIVFVTFEDNSYSKPIILGHLYREAIDSDGPGVISRNLSVVEQAVLPVNTTIGKVSAQQLSYLLNVTSDIQEQLDELRRLIQHSN